LTRPIIAPTRLGGGSGLRRPGKSANSRDRRARPAARSSQAFRSRWLRPSAHSGRAARPDDRRAAACPTVAFYSARAALTALALVAGIYGVGRGVNTLNRAGCEAAGLHRP